MGTEATLLDPFGGHGHGFSPVRSLHEVWDAARGEHLVVETSGGRVSVPDARPWAAFLALP